MQYEADALSDVGLVRSNNEDSYLVDKELNLFVVADGMGGYEKGEIASQVACESMAQHSNGPSWVDRLAELLGIRPTRYRNYATGGAGNAGLAAQITT